MLTVLKVVQEHISAWFVQAPAVEFVEFLEFLELVEVFELKE